jgi:hypothetical protein
VGDNATVSASAHFHNLQLQKSPSRVFGQNSGNSADISKAFFEMGISKFESSQVSQPVLRSEKSPLTVKKMAANGGLLPFWQRVGRDSALRDLEALVPSHPIGCIVEKTGAVLHCIKCT